MTPTVRTLLVALAAGTLGLAVSLVATGPDVLLRSDLGRRLHAVLGPRAPAGTSSVTVARVGQRLPDLRLPSLDGPTLTLPADLAGRPVLLNVWASWCAPCTAEMPALQRFADEQGANGVQVVGIALDDRAAVHAFVDQFRIRYPILLDVPGPADASVRLGDPAGVLPFSVLVSADGRLLKSRVGPFQPDELGTWATP